MRINAAVYLLLITAGISRVFAYSAVTITNTYPPSSTPAHNVYATVVNTSWLEHHNETWMNASAPNSLWFNGIDSNYNYEAAHSPARAPALPLAVRSPYTSAWIPTANNDSLNSQWPIFWDDSELGWEGIVTIDGMSYEWLGVGSRNLPRLSNLVPAIPLSTSYDSSYSNFTFAAGPVELTASFFSPVTPEDLCRTSIPLSYLMVSVVSKDGGKHNVSLYMDVNGAWVTQPSAPLTWSLFRPQDPSGNFQHEGDSNDVYTWMIQLRDQYVFDENNGQDSQRSGQGVFPRWGDFTWSSSQGQARSFRFQSGFSTDLRFKYAIGENLNDSVDSQYRSYDEQEPIFAFQHDFGDIGQESIEIEFTIGHIVTPAIRFLSSAGVESLQPWWASSSCYGSDVRSLINVHYQDLLAAQILAAQFDARLKRDIDKYYAPENGSNFGQATPPAYWSNGTEGQTVTGVDQFNQQYKYDSGNAYGYLTPSENGCNSTLNGLAIPDTSEKQSYYALTALAARQILAAYVLTGPSAATAIAGSEPLAFQKEIASNGNTNTVDVIFPAIPFFLWANPDILRFVLAPLFMYQENHFYPKQYSMHDLGSRFPNAIGHVEGNDEYMPVEETGNMIIMVYAIYRLSRTNMLSYVYAHYSILKQWAQYLVNYSLIPEVQLSTDDFAGRLANQSNLAIKGIVALAAMAEISNAVGDTEQATNYSSIAQDYYDRWTKLAIDPSGTHTLLAYQWRSSWGLLYNVYPAKLLNLSIIPDSLYKQQSDFYPSVSQVWGVPLDNRHYYTKSDWEMWTAATCEPSTRRLFVNGLAYWLNTTGSDRPFTDLYLTLHQGESPQSPDMIEFFARPVQGGLYSLLALVAAGIER